MQIAGADFNPMTFTMAVFWGGAWEQGNKGEHWHGQRTDLTPAPLCAGLNVACLLRAGFGD